MPIGFLGMMVSMGSEVGLTRRRRRGAKVIKNLDLERRNGRAVRSPAGNDRQIFDRDRVLGPDGAVEHAASHTLEGDCNHDSGSRRRCGERVSVGLARRG